MRRAEASMMMLDELGEGKMLYSCKATRDNGSLPSGKSGTHHQNKEVSVRVDRKEKSTYD